MTLPALRQDPLAAIFIFGRRALIFFIWKLLEKYEKWPHFVCMRIGDDLVDAKKSRKGSSLRRIFLLVAIDRNGFRTMKEEELIYKMLPHFF